METQYNFQIRKNNDHREWEQISPHSKAYTDRLQAILFAQRLARVFDAEIRFTEGENHLATSGTYISDNH